MLSTPHDLNHGDDVGPHSRDITPINSPLPSHRSPPSFNGAVCLSVTCNRCEFIAVTSILYKLQVIF